MRNILIIILALIFLTGCKSKEERTVNKEDRITELVAQAVKKTLYYPESYDPVKTKIESYNIDLINDQTISEAVVIYDLIEKVNEIQNTINYYEDLRDNYPPNNSQYKYCDSQIQNQISKRMKSETKTINSLNKLRRKYANAEKEFCGYIVNHSFRAKTNLGNMGFTNFLIILNKNEEIINIYDLNDPKIIKFNKICGIIKEMGFKDIPEEDIDLEKNVEEIKSLFN